VWKDLKAGRLRVEPYKPKPRDFYDSQGVHCVASHGPCWIEIETNEQVARVHFFTTAEGKVAGSGFPDPKELFVRGVEIRIIKDGQKCQICSGQRPPFSNPIYKRARWWLHCARIEVRKLCTWFRERLGVR
jgi:hypothetical protein